MQSTCIILLLYFTSTCTRELTCHLRRTSYASSSVGRPVAVGCTPQPQPHQICRSLISARPLRMDDGGGANANPIGPPRPEAICTFISSDDFLPGAQTLLFSLRRHLSGPLAGSAEAAGGRGDYGSEIVVLATSSVSDAVRTALCPIFCTRVIEVDHIPMPNTDGGGSSHVSAWDANCGLTK